MRNGNKRPKAPGEELAEQQDKDAVEILVRSRVQGWAEMEFYTNGLGRNPWHDGVARTVFWM